MLLAHPIEHSPPATQDAKIMTIETKQGEYNTKLRNASSIVRLFFL
jgi:hypothetical protein